MKQINLWEITVSFWEAIQSLIPRQEQGNNGNYLFRGA